MGDFLAGVGLFVAVLAAVAALLWEPSQRRSAAMLLALALIPVLIGGDQWKSTEITDLRDHAARFAALVLVALFVVAALTLLFRRRPVLLPLAVIATIPFRIPLHAGGQEANLLIPLYLVIAGGVLATVWAWREGDWASPSAGGGEAATADRAQSPSTAAGADSPTGPAAGRLVPIALSAVLLLYAIQSVYSEDFSRALQNVAFFYVPFTLAFVLLTGRRWDPRLLVWALCVAGAEALVFALAGFWEYGTRHLIWNSSVIQSNDFHTYFRVNSLFWDPNVYGRYLALTIVAILAAFLWVRSPRLLASLGALVAVLWLGLITTFSQSSFAALLVGLATLAALRWSLRWALAACAAAVLAAAVFAIAAGGSLKIDFSTEQTLNKDTAGRANLVSEGAKLFGDRPGWGYGSGSFSVAYQQHRTGGSGRLSVSHTEPITIAAEQGLLGLAGYLALLAAAFITLCTGMRKLMPGLRSPPSAGGGEAAIADRAQSPSTAASADSPTGPAAERTVLAASRAAILACFVALLAHTMAYAGFLEDPLTWALLAIGASLAAPDRNAPAAGVGSGSRAVPQSPARAVA